MTLAVAIAMILPMTLIHLLEVFTVLYPAPMLTLMATIKATFIGLVALV